MAPSICLGTKQIGEFHPVFIIAEIGQNHQGDIRIAKKLIKIAKVRIANNFFEIN